MLDINQEGKKVKSGVQRLNDMLGECPTCVWDWHVTNTSKDW